MSFVIRFSGIKAVVRARRWKVARGADGRKRGSLVGIAKGKRERARGTLIRAARLVSIDYNYQMAPA